MGPTGNSPLDYSDDGIGLLISGNIVAFLTTVVVALRFWARRLTRQRFGADDYLCLAALIAHHAFFVAASVCVAKGGLGRDMRITSTEDPHSVVILFQSVFAAEIAYTFGSPLVKLSVLAFYWRIFPTKTVKLGCKILGSVCIMWWIAVTITDFAACRPLKAFWLLELRALATTQCLDSILRFMADAIANTVIDLCILTLPIRETTKLHTSTRRKIHVCFIFLLGSIAFAASLVRTVSTAALWHEGISNFTKQFVVPGVTTTVEIYVAIIGACLPVLVPVYRKLRYGNPLRSYVEGVSEDTPPKPGNNARRNDSSNGDLMFERLGSNEDALDPGRYLRNHQVNASSTRVSSDGPYTGVESYPMGGIMVRHDLVLSEQNRSHLAV